MLGEGNRIEHAPRCTKKPATEGKSERHGHGQKTKKVTHRHWMSCMRRWRPLLSRRRGGSKQVIHRTFVNFAIFATAHASHVLRPRSCQEREVFFAREAAREGFAKSPHNFTPMAPRLFAAKTRRPITNKPTRRRPNLLLLSHKSQTSLLQLQSSTIYNTRAQKP